MAEPSDSPEPHEPLSFLCIAMHKMCPGRSKEAPMYSSDHEVYENIAHMMLFRPMQHQIIPGKSLKSLRGKNGAIWSMKF